MLLADTTSAGLPCNIGSHILTKKIIKGKKKGAIHTTLFSTATYNQETQGP